MNTVSEIVVVVIKSLVLFAQNTYGAVVTPYKTYRRLAASRNFGQLLFLAGMVVLYFSWGSALRVGITHPLVLTKNWVLTFGGAVLTFILAILGIYSVGKVLHGRGEVDNLVLPWGYSLLPTLIWFYFTSVSYFILPPPRNPSLAGRLFSFLFIVGSLGLFFWKGILYYLTLRFGMRLDLLRILLVTSILFPAGLVYALLMYKLGIFRVPFI